MAILDLDALIHDVDQSIKLYEGILEARTTAYRFEVSCIITHQWFPEPGIHFSCEPKSIGNLSSLNIFQEFELWKDEKKVASAIALNVHPNFSGILDDVKLGRLTQQVKKVQFAVPNFGKYRDFPRRSGTQQNKKITIQDDKYGVSIESIGTSLLESKLDQMSARGGGYFIGWKGEIVRIDGKRIKYNQIIDFIDCLGYYLSFIAGRRIAVLFPTGTSDSSRFWLDGSLHTKRVDSFRKVTSWASPIGFYNLQDPWINFRKIWDSSDGKKLLIYGLHWYFEAVKNAGLLEGSIILAQTALETLANWVLIEKLKILVGEDAKKITAANKIRILINIFNVSPQIPAEFSLLRDFRERPSEGRIRFQDGPEAICEIRNMLTHGSTSKFDQYDRMDSQLVRQAKYLALWYVELAFLYIFGFEGEYCNRITSLPDKLPFTSKFYI